MNENWTKYIEMLLQGELSKEDTAKLNAELERNPEMRKSLEQQKRVHEIAKRSGERSIVKNVGKAYRFQRNMNTGILSIVIAGILATAAYFAANHFSQKGNTEVAVDASKYSDLDKNSQLANCPTVYFEHDGKDAIFLSPKGVLISVPKKTFVLNGKPYNGKAIIQYQEAIDASDIIKVGLSTMAGDRLLETQGMFSLQAFTPEGEKLNVNDKDGIYLQVPVKENKAGMQLFQGVKNAEGEVDWQNPKPIEKLPVQANMLDLDLFPPGFEPKLDELKWHKKKKHRDSLYLSFEESWKDTTTLTGTNISEVPYGGSVPSRRITVAERKYLYGDNRAIDQNMTFEEAEKLGNSPTPSADLVNWGASSPFFYLEKREGRNKIGVKGQMEASNLGWNIIMTQGGSPNNLIPNMIFTPSLEGTYELKLAFFPRMFPVKATLSNDGKWPANQEVGGVDEVSAQDVFRFNYDKKKANLKYISTSINRQFDDYFYESKYVLEFKKGVNEITLNANLRKGFIRGALNHYTLSFSKVSEAATAGIAKANCLLPPSKVLAIWKKDFNGTILATKDFEKRMAAVHGACNEQVFDVYANQINKPLWQLDEQVVKMGYSNFQQFADERVGALKQDNAHMNTLRQFYQSNVSRLKDQAKKDKNFEKALRMAWDSKVRGERKKEAKRTIERKAQAFQEEYSLNLKNVMKQLGKTVGVTIHGGGTVYNIDKYVRDATVARKSTTITDPETGKTAEIIYNKMKAVVKDATKYGRLFMYLLPKEINSFQRINPVKGTFNYSLNNDMDYDIIFVGINESGYFMADKKNVSGGDLGEIKLKSVSEKEFERRVERMNEKRNTKPMSVSNELQWLKTERKDYAVQSQRKKMTAFRSLMRGIVYPCRSEKPFGTDNPFL